jgi:uncharacterized membrane protein
VLALERLWTASSCTSCCVGITCCLPGRMSVLSANLIADGAFHAGAWLAVLVGVLWLWRRSWRAAVNGRWTALVAAMVAGWGSFNVVEGLVDHYLLNLHHVRPGPNQAAYDIAFLILGVLLALGGFAWYKRTTASARAPAPQSRLHGDRGQSSLAEKHRLPTRRCLE